MDKGWLPFHPTPRRPRFVPPPGAVDAHCHVFGPGARFPYAAERRYTPCDAPKTKLWGHGADNRALVDALLTSQGRARGVATVAASVTDRELAALDAAGVRGVRFNF